MKITILILFSLFLGSEAQDSNRALTLKTAQRTTESELD